MTETELMSIHRERLLVVHEALLEIYGMPEWRDPLPPVDELVSTFLSQNTNDVNRDRAFVSIKEHYSNWEQVRDASEGEFVDVIRVAGLANQKGPNIQNALRFITSERGEIELDFLRDMRVEEARRWLTSLKGVGPKTAAIVLLFSMGIPAFPVDTHIYRVSGRIGLRPISLDVEKTHTYLESIAPPEIYASLHLNLIRLGRETCHARKPECAICPILNICEFESKNLGADSQSDQFT